MTRQRLSVRHIGATGTLQDEISAWAAKVNTRQRGGDLRVKIDIGRRELKSAYPRIDV